MDDTKTKTRYCFSDFHTVFPGQDFRKQRCPGRPGLDSECILMRNLGYKWTRDYDSTDEENVWDRIGSIFGGNTDRSGHDSVSEGDYCIHDHRRGTV